MTCETIPNRTRAFVKIQDGCNCFCSYCIIPYARGRCRSKPKEALRQEAAALAAAGYRELVLCGINLAFMGQNGAELFWKPFESAVKQKGLQGFA